MENQIIKNLVDDKLIFYKQQSLRWLKRANTFIEISRYFELNGYYHTIALKITLQRILKK